MEMGFREKAFVLLKNSLEFLLWLSRLRTRHSLQDMGSKLALLSGLRIQYCCGCGGIRHRCSSDSGPGLGILYATGAALKRKKKKKKKKKKGKKERKKCVSLSSGEVQDQGASRLGVWADLDPWSFLFPHMEEGVKEASFIRALILFMRVPPSWPNHLPKAPPPNTIYLGVRIST